MILHAEDGQVPVAHALEGAVVEVQVRRDEIGGQVVEADGEAVVLTGDLDPVRLLIQDGLVRPAVARILSLNVQCAPRARPSNWWPRQMPNRGL